MKQYTPEKLVAISRYRKYFPTLPKEIQTDIYARMQQLIVEEKQYCDSGNYKHMAQIRCSGGIWTTPSCAPILPGT